MPTPDPAATVVPLRPAPSGFEALMVTRSARGIFGSFVVFPGGRVEDIDITAGFTVGDDVSHRSAAVRELAEETGILATTDGMVAVPDVKGEDFYRWVRSQDVVLEADGLVLVSRWVTPEIAPRRFDTRFYLLACHPSPPVRIDTEELIDHSWVSPGDALTRYENGDWPMILPTLAHLRWLARRSSMEEALDSARGADGRTLIEPRRVEDGSMLPIHMPADI